MYFGSTSQMSLIPYLSNVQHIYCDGDCRLWNLLSLEWGTLNELVPMSWSTFDIDLDTGKPGSWTSQVTYVTMVPRVGNETLRPLGVATGNALSVTRSEDTYVKTPPVGRRQPMTSLPACHNISAAGRIHHQLLHLKLASEAWPEA